MVPFKIALFVCFFGINSLTFAQKCISNSLSSNLLKGITSNKCKWKAETFHLLTDVTISKEGTGPDLLPMSDNSISESGIWIGKNNTFSDYSIITISFSKPISSLSFIISAINNDQSGEEQVQNFAIYDSLNVPITSNVDYNWVTGLKSGIKESVKNATYFDKKTKSIKAIPGSCCSKASGKLFITSKQAFYSIRFKHQEMDKFISSANGIILAGDMQFCVNIPERGKKDKVEEIKINKDLYTNSVSKKRITKKEKSKPILSLEKDSVESKTKKEKPTLKSLQTILNHISFEQGQSRLIKSSFVALDTLANVMLEYPIMKIELHGHTDNQGSQKLNQILSEDRVLSVKKYLVSKGVSEERIFQRGFGGLKPLVENNTEENRKQNRRVELIITNE